MSNWSRAISTAWRACAASWMRPSAFRCALVETLDADRQPVHAARAKLRELVGFEGAGIGFERDFGVGVERQQRAHVRQQAVEPVRRQQARRAAADEHRMHLAAPDQRQRHFEIGAQRVEILVLRERVAFPLVRIEIAIRTLAHAPRKMHVQRQRRQRRQPDAARRREGLDDAVADFGGRRFDRESTLPPSGARAVAATRSRDGCWRSCTAGSSSAALAFSDGRKKYGS